MIRTSFLTFLKLLQFPQRLISNIFHVYHFSLWSGAEFKQNKYENSSEIHLQMKF